MIVWRNNNKRDLGLVKDSGGRPRCVYLQGYNYFFLKPVLKGLFAKLCCEPDCWGYGI